MVFTVRNGNRTRIYTGTPEEVLANLFNHDPVALRMLARLSGLVDEEIDLSKENPTETE